MSSLNDALITRIHDKNATIGIIGMGYVGLPLALRFCDVGFSVIGIDVDAMKVDTLMNGGTYIEHITSQSIAHARSQGLTATTDFSAAADADALILCVPTPLDTHREPDLTYVISTIESLCPHLRAGQIVSLESTTYPGTTTEELLPRIENAGFTVGKDIFLVYSPEREDPANPHFHTQTIPKVCGGVTAQCLAAGSALYSSIINTVVPVSSPRVAEMTKLLENIHRAVNIGLVNEMKIIADRMDIDIHEVIKAAATKPFGFVPYYPGPGLGGHCIPIDPFYLTWKAREYGISARFIELAGEVNSSMPTYVIEKLTNALNAHEKSVKGSSILILGLAYKKNVDDVRESPSAEIMEILRAKGADIHYSDPHVPQFKKMRKHSFDLESVALTPETLSSCDAVVLCTHHDAFDYKMIEKHASLIIDTRGVFTTPSDKIVKA